MTRTSCLTALVVLALSATPLWAVGPAPPVATGPVPNTMGTPFSTHGTVPTDAYLQHVGLLYQGLYRDALTIFQNDLASGIKTSQSRWIDSICYYTMVGECYYRLGRLGDALDNYNAALRLYMQYSDWMLQIKFQAFSSNPPLQTPWGVSTRGLKVARMPGNMLIAQGSLYIDQQLQQGGVVAPAQLSPVNVVEINRCTLLALKRRAELMGPVCPHDQLTADLLATFQRHPGPRNHWSEAWVDAQLGMALVGAGETGQALAVLKRSLVLGGEFDHPLTPVALLELGQLAAEAGDFTSASRYLEEASYSAVTFGDYTSLEEAFRYGEVVHLMASRPGIFPPLAKAITWAHTRDTELYASLLLSLGENSALIGQHGPALAALSDAKTAVAHLDMGQHEIGARLDYLTALLAYQKGAIPAGDDSLAAALNIERGDSRWLFQIKLADYYVMDPSGPRLGPHRALSLYEELLRDPTGKDWACRPLETLAVISTPHPVVYEHWFENTDPLHGGVEQSLEVADRARRHRFLSTLPFGGRLLALRWILEAPAATLDQRAQVERQDLLARYPKYADYAKQAHDLQEQLKSADLAPAALDAQRKQAALLADLAHVSQLQEMVLREMAVRRDATDLLFPPLRRTKDIQAALPPRHLLLVFFSTSRDTFAALLSKERYAQWRIESPQQLEHRVVALLRGLGNYDANRELTQAQVQDESWRLAARDVTDALLAGSKVNLYENIDELVVVPDGVMWYLPFETLQVAPKGKERNPKDAVSLITRSRIRYVPTLGLAAPDQRDRKSLAELGVVLGKLHPKDSADLALSEYDRLRKAVPHAVAIQSPLPAASPLYAGLFDRLVVFDDVPTNEKNFYDWSPLPLDKAKGAGSLAQWFTLPWKSPAEIILPGFHTAAENGLKSSVGPGAIGSEMFLSVCGLMSTGARTVLLSRWRTGGQTSYELIRQFVQELPYASADEAWQRSVQLQMDTPLDISQEPRVRQVGGSEALTAKNPFFWSGYMLVDTGWSPTSTEPAAPPVIRLPAAAGGAAPPALPMPPAGAAAVPVNPKGKKNGALKN